MILLAYKGLSRPKAKFKERKFKIIAINCDGLKNEEHHHSLATVIVEDMPYIVMG